MSPVPVMSVCGVRQFLNFFTPNFLLFREPETARPTRRLTQPARRLARTNDHTMRQMGTPPRQTQRRPRQMECRARQTRCRRRQMTIRARKWEKPVASSYQWGAMLGWLLRRTAKSNRRDSKLIMDGPRGSRVPRIEACSTPLAFCRSGTWTQETVRQQAGTIHEAAIEEQMQSRCRRRNLDQ